MEVKMGLTLLEEYYSSLKHVMIEHFHELSRRSEYLHLCSLFSFVVTVLQLAWVWELQEIVAEEVQINHLVHHIQEQSNDLTLDEREGEEKENKKRILKDYNDVM